MKTISFIITTTILVLVFFLIGYAINLIFRSGGLIFVIVALIYYAIVALWLFKKR